MLKRLIDLVFARRPAGTQLTPRVPDSPPVQWRDAPSLTMRDEVGEGVFVELTVATGHSGYVEVVGEGEHQDTIRSLPGVFLASLVPESDNPHDPNAIAVTTWDGRRIGYIPRQIAASFHARLRHHASRITCPAKVTGIDRPMRGVILDFEPVREALGLQKVSRDLSRLNYEASESFHRLTRQSRELVTRTRAIESSEPEKAVEEYRRAISLLIEADHIARTQGLRAAHEGYAANQTDTEALNRLVMSLIKLGRADEAAAAVEGYCERFPQAREMSLVRTIRARLEKAATKAATRKA
jgi:HIRAN domain